MRLLYSCSVLFESSVLRCHLADSTSKGPWRAIKDAKNLETIQCFSFFFSSIALIGYKSSQVSTLLKPRRVELTFHVSQVKVPVHQRGSVVEVLRHVIQPVGLHALHALVATGRHLQRHLDGVVLDVALGRRRRSVVERQQLGTCGDTQPRSGVRGQDSTDVSLLLEPRVLLRHL